MLIMEYHRSAHTNILSSNRQTRPSPNDDEGLVPYSGYAPVEGRQMNSSRRPALTLARIFSAAIRSCSCIASILTLISDSPCCRV